MTPMAAPESTSQSKAERGTGRTRVFFLFFLSPRKPRRKSAPRIPLENARNSEETGMLRRKMPTVPKISMEAVSFTRDPDENPVEYSDFIVIIVSLTQELFLNNSGKIA